MAMYVKYLAQILWFRNFRVLKSKFQYCFRIVFTLFGGLLFVAVLNQLSTHYINTIHNLTFHILTTLMFQCPQICCKVASSIVIIHRPTVIKFSVEITITTFIYQVCFTVSYFSDIIFQLTSINKSLKTFNEIVQNMKK